MRVVPRRFLRAVATRVVLRTDRVQRCMETCGVKTTTGGGLKSPPPDTPSCPAGDAGFGVLCYSVNAMSPQSAQIAQRCTSP